MNKTNTNANLLSNRFRLNLQILADNFAESLSNMRIFARSDDMKLDGIRLFQKEKPLSGNYIYLLNGCDVDETFRRFRLASFLIVGKADCSVFSDDCSILQLIDADDISDILNRAQQTFEKYQNWDRCLQLALNSINPLDEMLEASLAIFQNPIFAHDTNFYVLSCPRHVTGMSVWERDSRTGRPMVPLNLIHDFKTEMEYMRTLGTKGPDIYSEDMRGYKILYMNLWVDGIYEGRICIDELQSLIMPGHLQALQYLGSFIELCIKRHNLFHLRMGNDTRQFFANFLDGKITDVQQVQDSLAFLNWNRTDRYLCLRLEAEQQNEQMHSAVATLGHLESQVPEGRAFLYKQGIVVVVNLSYEHSSISDVISGLAIILRDGLFKMGASSELQDFFELPQGYIQAAAALDIGKNSGSMIWCYRFENYMLEYIFGKSCEVLSPELLCSETLLILRKYDADNNTDLYHTLQTYLELERNALQTANALYIHRSSLFYRLERIKKLTKIDLDNAKERLTLQISFCLLEK